MALRKGIVVDAHPGDHSVDLVLVDNYARLVGVQVQAHTASSRSGAIELPDVEVRKDKWNIADPTGQEVMALVDFVGQTPIVTGFLYPQISQMTHADGKLKYHRHTSDVQTYTDGEGNMGLLHPSGAHITIGTAPDPKDFSGQNVDKTLKVDRNTDKKVFLRVALAGNVAVLTMTPEGACTLHLDKTLDIDCTKATIKASDSIVLDTPQTHITGNVQIDGNTSVKGNVSAQGNIDSAKVVTGSTNVMGGGKSLNSHTHTAQGEKSETTGPH